MIINTDDPGRFSVKVWGIFITGSVIAIVLVNGIETATTGTAVQSLSRMLGAMVGAGVGIGAAFIKTGQTAHRTSERDMRCMVERPSLPSAAFLAVGVALGCGLVLLDRIEAGSTVLGLSALAAAVVALARHILKHRTRQRVKPQG